MEEHDLTLEVRDRVAWLTINRPHAMNAVTDGTVLRLQSVFADLAEREDVGCVVIRGAGERAFCAGHDLKEVAKRLAEGLGPTGGLPETTRLIEAMLTFPLPTIAAVKGYVRGGGNWLAASCDIVVAAEDATFAILQINFADFPTELMVPVMRRIGRGKVVDMILTADVVGAQEAKAIGYVDRLLPVEGFWDGVQELAQKIASRDAQAVRAGKEALALLLDLDWARATRIAELPLRVLFAGKESRYTAEAVERHIATVRGSGARHPGS